jgi:hypothetical protein
MKDRPSSILKKLKDKNLESKVLLLELKAIGIIPLGTARIIDLGVENFNGRKVYHLKAIAETLQYFSRLFKAKAEADSFVDTKKLHSLKFIQHVDTPGDYDYNREIIYDQRRKIMKIGDTEREILKDTQDPLSAIFYLRKQQFQLHKEFNLNINTNQKNYLLAAKVIDYKLINIGKDRYGLWLVSAEVKRRNKNPRHRTSVKIWFLDNKNKLPVLIKVVSAGGLITARLIDLE